MAPPEGRPASPRRIVVVGTTGTGKSGLARRLADRLGLPVVELDELHWLPGWHKRPEAEFLAAVARATAGERWIVVGNYRATWPLTWPRAELVVWVDGPFVRSLLRLLRRSIRRAWTRERVCNGNVETWRNLASRESIVLWFLRTFRRNRVRFAAMADRGAAGNGPPMRRLQSERDIDRLLAELAIPRAD